MACEDDVEIMSSSLSLSDDNFVSVPALSHLEDRDQEGERDKRKRKRETDSSSPSVSRPPAKEPREDINTSSLSDTSDTEKEKEKWTTIKKKRHDRKKPEPEKTQVENAKQWRPRKNFPLPPPTFLQYPVIMEDLGTGDVKYEALGPTTEVKIWKNTVGQVTSQRRLGPQKWLIGCTSEKQQQKLRNMTNLAGVAIKCSVPEHFTDGVIKPISTAIDVDEFHRFIPTARKITRLKNRDGSDSQAVRITFKTPILPETIQINVQEYIVFPYVAPVRRCTKCCRFGHLKTECRSKQTQCPKCGQPGHEGNACQSKRMHCINCAGNHSAAYQGCPEYRLRVRANKIKAKTFIMYSEAIKRAKKELETEKERIEEKQQRQDNIRPEHDPFWRREPPPPPITSTPKKSYASVASSQVGRDNVSSTKVVSAPQKKTTSAFPKANTSQGIVKKLKLKSKQVVLRKKLEQTKQAHLETALKEVIAKQQQQATETILKKMEQKINQKVNEELKQIKDMQIKTMEILNKKILADDKTPAEIKLWSQLMFFAAEGRESGDNTRFLRNLLSLQLTRREENQSEGPPPEAFYAPGSDIWMMTGLLCGQKPRSVTKTPSGPAS